MRVQSSQTEEVVSNITEEVVSDLSNSADKIRLAVKWGVRTGFFIAGVIVSIFA